MRSTERARNIAILSSKKIFRSPSKSAMWSFILFALMFAMEHNFSYNQKSNIKFDFLAIFTFAEDISISYAHLSFVRKFSQESNTGSFQVQSVSFHERNLLLCSNKFHPHHPCSSAVLHGSSSQEFDHSAHISIYVIFIAVM